jgi:3-hydroxyacyl-[acyl-carrier-protein] dehydratase
MRWFWVDRFVEFHSGQTAKAVKNVSLSEEHMHDHFPGYPIMPYSLILEGMAQTGGILLGESHKFSKLVFLAKVPKFVCHDIARPGDQLIYSASLQDANDSGGMTAVTAHVGDRLIAEAEILFAHLEPGEAGMGNSNVVQEGLRLVLMDLELQRQQ